MAITDEPDVALNAVAGDHVYDFAPLAVNIELPPLPKQIEFGAGTFTIGVGNMKTSTGVVFEQPSLPIPVTKYVVVTVGLATTDESVAELNPVDGAQK